MNVAAIDIGSNSVRLLITGGAGEVRRVSRVTGLARGVDASGTLSASAVDETVDVIRSYAAAIAEHGCQRVGAVATSAVRDAANGSEVMARLSIALGVDPAIVSGDREARLSYHGATDRLPTTGGRFVIDIGGGSTELIRGGESIDWLHSYDIGSVRLTDRHLAAKPATPSQVAEARRDASAVLAEPKPPHVGECTVFGVAGTLTNLFAIHMGLTSADLGDEEVKVLTAPQIERLIDRLAPLSLPELRAVRGMDPDRAPVMLGGAIVAAAVLDAIGATALAVSGHGLLDGLAAELLAQA